MTIWEGEEREGMTSVTEGSSGDRIPPPLECTLENTLPPS